MSPEEYGDHDATALAQRVQSGESTPLAVTEAAIHCVELLNSRLNAVVETSFDLAREAATRIDRRAPLAGVPFLAKDMNIDVAGLHLTASCRWLASLPAAAADAPLAARWRTAGLSILGRTNTPEFAGDFVTEPTWRGATHNPWQLEYSPGGSSGGAAAAVAAGMVPIAHGTDSGGSIRVPAAACGLVGLKPSRGWVPVGPHLDELAGGLDCEHVLARTVRDTARMLDVTAGPEPTSRVPLRIPANGFSNDLGRPLRPLRIGVALTAPGGIRPESDIGACVEEVASFLRRAGHEVGEFAFPVSANIGEPALIVWLTAVAEEIDYYTNLVGRPPRPDELEALTRAGMAMSARWTAVDYVRGRRALTVATRDMALLLTEFDILLLPTTAHAAVKTGQIDGRTDAFDFARWNAQSYGYAPFTEIFNVSGQPAISLPLGMSRLGVPIGVQFAAALGDDAGLLHLAAWLERELPWADRLAALRRRFLSG